MKRFHVHLAVDNLDTSIEFYSQLFGVNPEKQRQDYAKWVLDDPRLNFAISSRGHSSGLNHLGFQAENPEELAHLKGLAESASATAVLEQRAAACCYAKSEKHWTTDPQGIAWEHFLTMAEVETFGEDTVTESGACCIPLHGSEAVEGADKSACCVPTMENTAGSCCG